MKGWDPKWGGALELFPVENGQDVGLPGVRSVRRVDVKWGQIVFFEVRRRKDFLGYRMMLIDQVQPGRSYHAVEEVVIGQSRQRLGVSGW
jgi:Rps23 Pro-64 3,4-dihydroxylase Tpa1-like proline 4-hydroxylase